MLQRNFAAAAAGAGLNAGAVDDARRRYLAGALAVEEVAGVDAVQEKAVRSVALAVGPDRRVAQAGVCAGSAAEFSADAAGLRGQAGKAARRQWHRFNLCLIENVADGGIDGIHQRRRFHFDRGGGLADLERRVYGRGAIGLHRDVLRLLQIVSVGLVRQRVGADRQVHQGVSSGSIGGGGTRQGRRLLHGGDGYVGNHAAGCVGHFTGDASKRLLREAGRTQTAATAAIANSWERIEKRMRMECLNFLASKSDLPGTL